jgi:hypothetical protein
MRDELRNLIRNYPADKIELFESEFQLNEYRSI